jgi:large subunit ribosomal protein L23
MQEEFQDSRTPEAATKAPETERNKLAEQAKRLQEGKEEWTPTWKALGLSYERPALGRGNAGEKQ